MPTISVQDSSSPDYEVKGVPVRLAIGQRDIEEGTVEVMRRDTLEKETYPIEGIVDHVAAELDNIQERLFERAFEFRNRRTIIVDSY